MRICSYFAENIHLFDDFDLVGHDSLVVVHRESVTFALIVVKSSVFIDGEFNLERSWLLHLRPSNFIEYLIFQQLSSAVSEAGVEFKHVLQDVQDFWSGEWELFLELNFAGVGAESFDVLQG